MKILLMHTIIQNELKEQVLKENNSLFALENITCVRYSYFFINPTYDVLFANTLCYAADC